MNQGILVLLVFSLLAANDSLVWFTFEAIPREVEEYYGFDHPSDGSLNTQIALLISWAGITFCFVSPWTSYVLQLPITGLALGMKIASSFSFVGTFIICIPTILHDLNIGYSLNNHFWHTVVLLHAGAIIKSVGSPFILSIGFNYSSLHFFSGIKKTKQNRSQIERSMVPRKRKTHRNGHFHNCP